MRAAVHKFALFVGFVAVAMVAAVLLPGLAHAAGSHGVHSHHALPLVGLATTDILQWLKAAGRRAVAIGDGNSQQARANRYGEQIIRGAGIDRIQLADEGAYFTCQNSVDGTGVALNAQIQAFTDTNGFMVLKNNALAGSGIRVYLDYLKLVVTAATTAVASVDFVTVLDTISRSPTTASSGTTLTPVNVNGDDTSSAALLPIVYNAGGAMTIPAASTSKRILGHAHAATGLHFAGDLIEVRFDGMPGDSTMGLTAVRAVGANSTVCHHAPVIIGPQQTVVIHRWSLTEAGAPSYALELGWFERAA